MEPLVIAVGWAGGSHHASMPTAYCRWLTKLKEYKHKGAISKIAEKVCGTPCYRDVFAWMGQILAACTHHSILYRCRIHQHMRFIYLMLPVWRRRHYLIVFARLWASRSGACSGPTKARRYVEVRTELRLDSQVPDTSEHASIW
jgi:hypothetical protein